jgi:hypothetical protein
LEVEEWRGSGIVVLGKEILVWKRGKERLATESRIEKDSGDVEIITAIVRNDPAQNSKIRDCG